MCENEVADECVVVEYSKALPKGQKLARRLYRTSLVCGFVPLVFGASITLTYMLTGSSFFESMGFLTILLGFAATGICGICLVWYGLVSFLNRLERAFRILMRIIGAGLLMAINFPAAGLCIEVAVWRMSRSTIVVVNNTNSVIEDMRLTGGTMLVDLGDLPSGERIKEAFNVPGECSLDLVVGAGTAEIVVTVEPYCGGLTGFDNEVVFSPGGKIDVFDR